LFLSVFLPNRDMNVAGDNTCNGIGDLYEGISK